MDLIDAFHLLLCVLDLLVVHLPDQLRIWSLLDIISTNSNSNNNIITAANTTAVASTGTRSATAHHQHQLHLQQQQQQSADTLERLCRTQGANLVEVRKTRQNLFNPLVVTLRDSRILAQQPARLPSLAALSSNLYLGSLLEHHLAANHLAMTHEYDILLASTPGVNFDERLFVDEPDQIGAPK